MNFSNTLQSSKTQTGLGGGGGGGGWREGCGKRGWEGGGVTRN